MAPPSHMVARAIGRGLKEEFMKANNIPHRRQTQTAPTTTRARAAAPVTATATATATPARVHTRPAVSGDGWALIMWALVLVYMMSPVDVVPDVIPIVGWADDLLLLSVAAFIQGRLLLGLSVNFENVAQTVVGCGFLWFVILLLLGVVLIIALLKYIFTG